MDKHAVKLACVLSQPWSELGVIPISSNAFTYRGHRKRKGVPGDFFLRVQSHNLNMVSVADKDFNHAQ
jgi:hypothetical protein